MPGPNVVNQLSGLGATIKGLRAAAGLTQDALAYAAGISAQLVSLLERGEVRDPHVSCAVALARVLDVSTDYLLGVEKGICKRRVESDTPP